MRKTKYQFNVTYGKKYLNRPPKIIIESHSLREAINEFMQTCFKAGHIPYDAKISLFCSVRKVFGTPIITKEQEKNLTRKLRFRVPNGSNYRTVSGYVKAI